jgi:hypothetical protein
MRRRRAARRFARLFVVPFVVFGVVIVHGVCMEALDGHAAHAEVAGKMTGKAGVEASAHLSGSDPVPIDPPCHKLDESDRVTPPAPSFLLLMALFPLGFAWRPGPAAFPWRVLRTLPRGGAGARSPIVLCVIRV